MLPALKMRDYKVGSVSDMYLNYGITGSSGGVSSNGNRLPDIGGGVSASNKLPSLGDAQPFTGSLDIVGTKMLMRDGMGAPEMRDRRESSRQPPNSDRSSVSGGGGDRLPSYGQYDLDDRVEYNPSLAKLTNFSSMYRFN